MKKSTLAIVAVALGAAALGATLIPSGSDRVKEGCFMGDRVYQTRDGGYGFVEGDAGCSEGAGAPYAAELEGDVMPVMLD